MNELSEKDKTFQSKDLESLLDALDEANTELTSLKLLPVHDGCKPYDTSCMNCQVGKCAFIGRLLRFTNAAHKHYVHTYGAAPSALTGGGSCVVNKINLLQQKYKKATIQCVFSVENMFQHQNKEQIIDNRSG